MAAPTQADFITFLRNIVQIPAAVLPDDSPYITQAYTFSLQWVYCPLEIIGDGMIYNNAVYNFAADYLINWCPDDPNLQPPNNTFFAKLRAMFNINTFKAGVIQSSYDETTGESMVVPDFYKTLTLSNMQNLLTPYGRAYLAIAQSWGSLWGLS